MCLITVSSIKKLKEVFTTTGLLESVYLNNPDGLGFMYRHKGQFHVVRTLPKTVAEARKAIDALPNTDAQIVCHWRMRTHGAVNLDNCHPYRVNKDTFLAHNGVLRVRSHDKNKSDTWHFIQKYLAHVPTDMIHSKPFLKTIAALIGHGNRFVFMSDDGRISIVNKHLGISINGVWFSNTYAWDIDLLWEEICKTDSGSESGVTTWLTRNHMTPWLTPRPPF